MNKRRVVVMARASAPETEALHQPAADQPTMEVDQTAIVQPAVVQPVDQTAVVQDRYRPAVDRPPIDQPRLVAVPATADIVVCQPPCRPIGNDLSCHSEHAMMRMDVFYEAAGLAKQVEFDASAGLFAKMTSFERQHCRRSIYTYDDRLEYGEVDLTKLWRKLTIEERLRIIDRQLTSSERYDFRLMAFAVHNVAIDVNDVFVMCDRMNVIALIKKMAELRLDHKQVGDICDRLGLDYPDVRLKCQQYWTSLRARHASTLMTDFA